MNLLHLIRHILVNSRLLSSRSLSRKQQSPNCFLLKLPIELLGLIHGHLYLSDQMCIRHTCLAMYNSLERPTEYLDKGEKIGYLTLICQDLPDCWLSERRPYIREVQDSDLSKSLEGPPVIDRPPWYAKQIYEFEHGALMVEYKHVQLAIKYSQLETKTQWQAKALELLLEPYKTQFAPRLDMHPKDKAQEIGYFEWYPKVVSGRYLTFSQRSFVNNWRPEPVRLSKLGCFGPCMHQYTDPVLYAHLLARQRLAIGNGSGMEDRLYYLR